MNVTSKLSTRSDEQRREEVRSKPQDNGPWGEMTMSVDNTVVLSIVSLEYTVPV
jgi:hypothetical protein